MEPLTLGEWYLSETGGDAAINTYRKGLSGGQRIGQAFFNALTPADQDKLCGTSRDPFYRDDSDSVHTTIVWLIDNAGEECTMSDEFDEYYPYCPACGEPFDYCQGHGEIGDPFGAQVLAEHEWGEHNNCHPRGCDDAPNR